ncbi:hypothetical protein SRHO_G00039080 [Serrasalmus rhombeus]
MIRIFLNTYISCTSVLSSGQRSGLDPSLVKHLSSRGDFPLKERATEHLFLFPSLQTQDQSCTDKEKRPESPDLPLSLTTSSPAPSWTAEGPDLPGVAKPCKRGQKRKEEASVLRRQTRPALGLITPLHFSFCFTIEAAFFIS